MRVDGQVREMPLCAQHDAVIRTALAAVPLPIGQKRALQPVPEDSREAAPARPPVSAASRVR